MPADRRSHSFLALVVLAVVGLLLSACTGGTGGGGGAGDGRAATGGVLRVGAELAVLGGPRALDPTESRSVEDFRYMQLIYGTLLRARPDGTYAPSLAESYQVKGDDTVVVKLRDGLVFHDGTPLDAEAVKFSIERNIAAENQNLAPQITEISSVRAVDDRTIKITLETPTIGAFFELLAGRETMPVSPTAAREDPEGLSTHPVGAGPYRVEEYRPGSLQSLRKFDRHWEADAWKLAGIDFVHTPPGPQQVNTLLSGQVDMVQLNAGQIDAVSDRGNFAVKAVTSNANFLYLATCKSKPPFDSLKFRQALAYALDRQAINEAMLDGRGEPMWQMWPKASPYFTESLEGTYAYDPDRARSLLAEAGWKPGDELPMAYPADIELLKRMGEIVQAQLGEVGVKIVLEPAQDIVTEFYQDVKTPVAASLWIRGGLQKVTRSFGKDSVANVCSYHSDELERLTTRIAALPPDDPRVPKLWDQVNRFVVKNALWEFVVWQPLVYAWADSKVGGVDEIYAQIQGPNFRSIFIEE